jgi:hypothetical protein
MQRPTMQNLLRLTETQSSRLYHGYRKGVKRVLRKRVRRPRRAQKSGVMNSFGRHAEGACRSTGSVVGGNMITKTTLRPYKREGWERLGERRPREKKDAESHGSRDCVSAAETSSRAPWDSDHRAEPLRVHFPSPQLVPRPQHLANRSEFSLVRSWILLR